MDNDCWLNIFLYLPFKNISNCSLVCKQFTDILNRNAYWKIIIKRDFSRNIYNNAKTKYKQYHNLNNFGIKQQINNILTINELNLMRHKLTSLLPEIKLLTNLKYLYLSDNQLTNVPDEVYQLTKLNSLFLSCNKLTSISPKISNLTNLVTLTISDNPWEYLPKEIGLLPKLKIFYAHNIKIKSWPIELNHLLK